MSDTKKTAADAPAQYSVATMLDIARIPKERIPALLAELPRMLDQIRPLVALIDANPDKAELIAKTMIWVDDGITDGSADKVTVTIQPKSSPSSHDQR